jgi:hypothetical protein
MYSQSIAPLHNKRLGGPFVQTFFPTLRLARLLCHLLCIKVDEKIAASPQPLQ